MAEWFNASVLKTEVPLGTVGSNPTLSTEINYNSRMDKRLSRLAHNQKIESSNLSPATNKNMSENRPTPTYEVLPLDPENNPPETIEEIEVLLNKLQDKAINIKQQLEVVAIREKQGLEVDYERVKRALYAKACTHRSISGLQRILKNRKQQSQFQAAQERGTFEKFFFEEAKERLSASLISTLMDNALARMKEGTNSKSW